MKKGKLLLIGFGIFAIFLVTILLYRNHLTHWMVEKYFAEKDIKIRFDVSSFNFSGISLKNIVIEDTIKIENLSIAFKSSNFSLMNLKSFSIEMETLDIEEAKILLAKLGSKTDQKEQELNFTLFSDFCNFIKPLSLDIHIHDFLLKEKKTPLDLHLSKDKGSNKTSLELEGHLISSPLKEKFSMKKWDFTSDNLMECKSKSVKITINNLKSHWLGLRFISKPFNIESLDLQSQKGSITLNEKEEIQIDIIGEWNFSGDYGQNKIKAHWNSGHILGKAKLQNLTNGELEVIAKNFDAEVPQKISVAEVQLKIKSENNDIFPIKGKYALKEIKYESTEDKDLVQGVTIQGQLNLKKKIYNSIFSLSDPNKVLQINGGRFLYNPNTKKVKVLFNKKQNFMEIKTELAHLFPFLKKMEPGGDGKIMISGFMSYWNETFKGNLELSGKKLNYNSKHAKAKGVEFRHNLKNYPNLTSDKDQSFKAEEITYGPTVKNLNIHYHIKNLSDIQVTLLDFEVEGAEVHAADFQANAIDRVLTNFKANIYKLPLQRALKLGLGDSVTAEGSLDGQLQIEFKNQKPIATGTLFSTKKGRIRYRKPGATPPDHRNLSSNPMAILESYLYDFYYESLSIDFHTDEKYDMKMTLRALGHNPSYLNGKPLKLNVNLEQNLLAAFQAMMLTYDLPNKIKEKIEQIGKE